MSDANMATSTKQVIISLVIVGVMVATIDQIGRNFLLAKFTAGIDSVESGSNAPIDATEKNFEARFVHIEEDIRELRRGQEALNLRVSALTERVARIEGFLFASAERRARAEQAPLKSEADRVQIAP